MRYFLVILWAYFVSWLTSALVHVVDSDVGSLQALLDPSVLLSVSIVALIMVGPVLVCSAAYARGQWRGFTRAVAIFAVAMGIVAAALGFGGRSILDWVLALVGMSALFGLILVMASLPTIWVGQTGKRQAVART